MSDLDPNEVVTTPREVIEAFGRLTGIRLREPFPQYVMAQAVTFAKHFTIHELELVVFWTKREIAREKGGFIPASLQWHVLFGRHGAGDEMLTFQNRLGLASEAVRKGWRPPIAGMAVRPVVKPVGPVQERFSEEEGKRAAAELREFAAKLKGGQG